MGRLLNNLIDSFVEHSDSRKRMDGGSAFNMKKELERDLVKEVLSEHADELEELSRERDVARWKDKFHDVLVQCVILAFAIGLLGSHVYGLVEALLYQPSPETNTIAMLVGTLAVLVACIVVVGREYASRLLEAVKELRSIRGGSRDE